MKILLGLLFLIIGIGIRIISIKTLKGDFSFVLKSPNNIVVTGIYKYMRHPSYLGSLFMIFGLSLISSIVGTMALSYAFFVSRITEEEKILQQRESYRKYRNKTGMLIPKIRRHNG